MRALLARAKDGTHLHTPNWHFPLTSHSAETFPFSYLKFQGLLKFLLERCSWKSKGCLHEKTRTGASFIPGWLSDFVSRLHIMTGSFHISLFEGTLQDDSKSQHYACATRSSLPGDRFHTETVGRFGFTWYRCEISYRREILAPVQEPCWTHVGGWLAPAWHFVVVSCKQI